MKKLLIALIMFGLLLTSNNAWAQETLPLGNSNLALKVGYITFQKDTWKNSDVDSGLYLGIEGMKNLTSNLYLGAEVGYVNNEGTVQGDSSEITWIPIEINLKYVFPISSDLNLGIGGGLSYNYLDDQTPEWQGVVWVLGGDGTFWIPGTQMFIDLNYNVDDRFFIGINGKYKYCGSAGDKNPLDNMQIGGQAGMMF